MRTSVGLFICIALFVGLGQARAETAVWDVQEVFWGEDYHVFELQDDPDSEIVWEREDGLFFYNIGDPSAFAAFSFPTFGGLASSPADFDNDGNYELFYYVGPSEFTGRSLVLYDVNDGMNQWEWVAEIGESYEILRSVNGIDRLSYDNAEMVNIRYQVGDTIVWERIYRFDDMPADVSGGMTHALPSLRVAPSPVAASARTTVSFNLPSAGSCQLGVYDVNGRLVEMLVDEQRQSGPYQVDMTTRDAGVYFLQLRTEAGMTVSRKLVVVR